MDEPEDKNTPVEHLNEQILDLIMLLSAMTKRQRALSVGKLLQILSAFEPISQRELAEKAAIRPQSLSEQLSKLEAVGLVQRKASETDRRVVYVSLTEAGRQADHTEARLAFASQFISALTEDEKKTLKMLLDKLALGNRDASTERQMRGPGHSDHREPPHIRRPRNEDPHEARLRGGGREWAIPDTEDERKDRRGNRFRQPPESNPRDRLRRYKPLGEAPEPNARGLGFAPRPEPDDAPLLENEIICPGCPRHCRVSWQADGTFEGNRCERGVEEAKAAMDQTPPE